jgi:hypothetical protein
MQGRSTDFRRLFPPHEIGSFGYSLALPLLCTRTRSYQIKLHRLFSCSLSAVAAAVLFLPATLRIRCHDVTIITIGFLHRLFVLVQFYFSFIWVLNFGLACLQGRQEAWENNRFGNSVWKENPTCVGLDCILLTQQTQKKEYVVILLVCSPFYFAQLGDKKGMD